MTILTIAGSKGGVGKTTVASCLAAILARAELPFLAVDADPEGPFARFCQSIHTGPRIEVLAIPDENTLANTLRDERKRWPLVVVDTAGFSNLSSMVAIGSADAVLMPTKCSEDDLVRAGRTAAKVQAMAATTRREIPARVLLNGCSNREVVPFAAEQLRKIGLDLMESRLGQRTAYEQLTHTGRMPTSGEAWREVMGLVEELEQLHWLPAAWACS